MKKLFTKISLLFIGLMLCAGNAWGTVTIDNIEYELSESAPWTATVADQGVMPKYLFGDHTIPEEVTYEAKTYTVTKVAANAYHAGIISAMGTVNVILPSTITEIGASAFVVTSGDFEFILNATTPPTLGEDAFPSGAVIKVPSASLMAYQIAYAGKEYTISAQVSNECGDGLTWSVMDMSAYMMGVILVIAYDGEGTGVMTDFPYISPWLAEASTFTSISIAEGVTHIGNYAFFNCANVTAVSVPSTVTSIGEGAFAGCTSIASMTIPSSVTSIGEFAFTGMSITPTIAAGDITIDDGEGAAGVIALLNDSRNITINRPAQMEHYNTICLPFALDAGQIAASSLANAEIYKFSNAEKDGDNLDLHFQPVTTIEAGVPYFIRYPQDGDNLTGFDFDDVTVSTTTAGSVTHGDVTLHGTLSTVSVSGNDKLYLAAGNELHWSSSTKNIPPFRAYFSVAGLGAGAPPRARIVERENTATDIESVQSSVISSEKIIENGQLFIIKNGVKYNAQGQIVK